MNSKLKVVRSVVDPKATDWDKRVTEVIRDFVQLGELLIEGRDGQYYRELGYDTFEDYCKSKQGLSIRHSSNVIRSSLVYKAIASGLGGTKVPPRLPETLEHVRQIGAMASVNVEKRKVTTKDGKARTIEQPVGIKNPQALADQWTKTVSEFEKRKAKAEKSGTKPPTFSGKFVRNLLPNKYKVAVDRGFNCNPVVRLNNRLYKLAEDLEQQGFINANRLGQLVLAEPPAMSFQLQEAKEHVDNVLKALSKYRELLDEYEEIDQ